MTTFCVLEVPGKTTGELHLRPQFVKNTLAQRRRSPW